MVIENTRRCTPQTTEEYTASLDKALTSYLRGDEQPFEEHVDRYQIQTPSDPLVKRASIMKAATARTPLPMKLRKKAKQWLHKHGLSSLGGGDVKL